MKKCLCAVLALFMALSLAGCGGDKTLTDEQKAEYIDGDYMRAYEVINTNNSNINRKITFVGIVVGEAKDGLGTAEGYFVLVDGVYGRSPIVVKTKEQYKIGDIVEVYGQVQSFSSDRLPNVQADYIERPNDVAMDMPSDFTPEWANIDFVEINSDNPPVGKRVYIEGEVRRKGIYFNFDLSGNGGYYAVDGSNLVLEVEEGQTIQLWAIITGKKDDYIPILAGVCGRVKDK